jgi:hypothetical protein
MSSIDDAIANAQEAAQNAPSVPAVQEQSAGVPAVGSGAPMGMGDFMTGGMSVDDWLKVKFFGLLIGDSDKFITDGINVEINLSEVSYCQCIKFGNNPTTYNKTYDGVSCVEGGTWAEAVSKAKAIDQKARSYNSADIPMTLLDEVNGVASGTRLGHSLSTTNRNNWQSFVRKVIEAGNDAEKDIVEVKITHEKKEKNSNQWGLLQFELIEPSGE